MRSPSAPSRRASPALSAQERGPQLHVQTLSLGALTGPKPAPASKAAPSSPKLHSGTIPARKPRAAGRGSPARQAASQTQLALLEPLLVSFGEPMATQTDTFARPPAPPSEMLLKAGVDAATCIEPGDLFDFEREVAPVLERLVGLALESAQQEVQDGLRLAAVRQRRRQIEQGRYREAVDVARMEGDDQRRREAAAWRQRELEEKAERQAQLEAKLAALGAARELAQAALEKEARRLQLQAELASFGRTAEREVVGFLEAAGIAQLEAMRLATPHALSLAGSRRSTGPLLSRAATPPPARLGSAHRGATAQQAVPRPPTALAAELVAQALQQAEAEAVASLLKGAMEGDRPSTAASQHSAMAAPVYRPSTALAADLVSGAMERVQADAAAGLLGGATTEEQGSRGAELVAPRPPTALAAELVTAALAAAQAEVLAS